jgi:PhnB protein
MSKILAYVHFKNNCREAMTFYQECLGGELMLQAVKDSPMKDMFPPHLQDIILHADLTNGDLTLLGSEMPTDDQGGHTITLTLTCDTKAELFSKFDKLAAGGKIIHPGETFFGGTMGDLVDKFGIRWGVFSAEK